MSLFVCTLFSQKLFWVPRREDNNPKTIDQIHKEVAQEAIQKNQFVQQFQMQQQQQQQHARSKGSGRGETYVMHHSYNQRRCQIS